MGIQLLSINHKTAPLAVRKSFAFDEAAQLRLMQELREIDGLNEVVAVSTCNRTELYASVESADVSRKVFGQMSTVLLKLAACTASPEPTDSGSITETSELTQYMRLYQGDSAVHHLFAVAAGLDSMVLGEDQILGQVKAAHALAMEHELCGTVLNTLFRLAVTAAKKVKTDTCLSRTSVSTATLALKAAEKELGTLHGKTLLVIGASGKIGSIVVKNALCIDGLSILATVRNHNAMSFLISGQAIESVPYEDRYLNMRRADVVVSATSSPHFTITAAEVRAGLTDEAQTGKRVFVDLAVPMDIEDTVTEIPGISLYNMDTLSALARENNLLKQEAAEQARGILQEFEEEFRKWLIFRTGKEQMDRVRTAVAARAQSKGMENAMDKLFFEVREHADAQELSVFMGLLERLMKQDS